MQGHATARTLRFAMQAADKSMQNQSLFVIASGAKQSRGNTLKSGLLRSARNDGFVLITHGSQAGITRREVLANKIIPQWPINLYIS